MLTDAELGQVCVVLVRARNPNNIGAVARAMHDFGFARLRVVNEYRVPFETARSAVDASEVLAGAEVCGSVAEAVRDCTLVIGTTAVGDRALEHELVLLPEGAARVRAELRSGRVALLFGSEKTGLSNEELSYCHWLMTVPMKEYPGTRHASMNLGQAVAVCLWELVRETGGGRDGSGVAGADSGELERLTALLLEVMEKTEYTRRHPANSDAAQVRRLVRGMGLDAEGVRVWMGILRQVLWRVG